jgi:hypothetical protein
MLCFAIAAALAGLQDPAPVGEVLLVRGADGWELVCDASDGVCVGGAPAVVPLLTRSEVVARAVAGPDGFEFATLERDGEPARLAVSFLAHPTDHQVLQTSSSTVLVGPPTLPLEATDVLQRNALPWLARNDRLSLALNGARVRFAPATTDAQCIVVVERPGSVYTRSLGGAAHCTATVFAIDQWDMARVAPTWAVGRTVDQVFAATLVVDLAWEPLAIEEVRREAAPPTLSLPGNGMLATEGRSLVVRRVARPTLESGTATFLVTFESATSDGSSFDDADAPLASENSWLVDAPGDFGVHFEGPDEQLDIRPTMGPGAAMGDIDLDGWCDLFVVQGAGRGGSEMPTSRVFANVPTDTGRTFEDRTDTWGGASRGAGMGALLFDANGDGDLDLYVANQGPDVLFENTRVGNTGDRPLLVDVSASAGVGGNLWSAAVCAGDIDHDGDLDLYVTSYLDYDESKMPPLEELLYRREDPVAMLPFAFPGQRNTLLVNESDANGLKFVDRTAEAGVLDEAGRSMQAVMFDFDRDGALDIHVANDVSPNVLFKGRGDGTFQDISFQTGLDDPRGSMGTALGDVDLDGDEDLFVSNWELEANALWIANIVTHASQRHRVATFRDTIVKSGLGPYGVGVTGWGTSFFDLENDGDLDLYVANGYTSPDYESTGICVAQPDHLFVNDGTGRFKAAFERIAPFAPLGGRHLPSRAVVECDFDRDGDMDLFVTSNNSAHRLLENRAPRAAGSHWFGVRLSEPGANPFVIGARVEVRTDRRTFVRTLLAGTSYLAGNPPELLFGLGPCERVESVVVHLPGGRGVREFAAQPLDTWVTLELTE